jgi:hypothetical protein
MCPNRMANSATCSIVGALAPDALFMSS